MATKAMEDTPTPETSRAVRQKRIQDALKLANSSKRKVIPKRELQALLQKLQSDLKEEGNELFQESQFIEACKNYNNAMSVKALLKSEGLSSIPCFEEVVLCNRAECLLQIGDEDSVRQALQDCNVVLTQINHDNKRAIYRKAKALKKLGRFGEAHKISTQLQRLCPKNKQFSELLREINELIMEEGRRHRYNGATSAQHLHELYNSTYGAEDDVNDEIDLEQVWLPPHIDLLPPEIAPHQRSVLRMDYPAPGTRYYNPGFVMPRRKERRQAHVKHAPPVVDDGEVDESWLPDTMKKYVKQEKAKNKNRSKPQAKSPLRPSSSNSSEENVLYKLSETQSSGIAKGAEKMHHNTRKKKTEVNSVEAKTKKPERKERPPIKISGQHGKPDSSKFNNKGSVSSHSSDKSKTSELPTPSETLSRPIRTHPVEQPNPEGMVAAADGDDDDDGTDWITVTPKKSTPKKVPMITPVTKPTTREMNIKPHLAADDRVSRPGLSAKSYQSLQQPSKKSAKAVPKKAPAVTTPPSIDSLPAAFRDMMKTHDFSLACRQCHTQTPGQFGQGSYNYNTTLEHNCFGNILLCCRKMARVFTWKKIRPRTDRKYAGKYCLCNGFSNEERCPYREDKCQFCHSEEEIDFWTRERRGNLKREPLMVYLKHLPNKRTCASIVEDVDTPVGHHLLNTGAKPLEKTRRALFSVPDKSSGPSETRVRATTTIVRNQACLPVSGTPAIPSIKWKKTAHLPVGGTSAVSNIDRNQAARLSASRVSAVQPPPNGVGARRTELPFRLKIICKACWQSKKQVVDIVNEGGRRSRCFHQQSKENHEIILCANRKWVDVNCIPLVEVNRHPSSLRMCIHWWRGKDHFKELTGRECANPHSMEEMKMWTWQLQQRVLTLNDLKEVLKTSVPDYEEVAPKPTASAWQSEKKGRGKMDWAHQRQESNYCEYCKKHCNSSLQLQQHFKSSKHEMRVLTDKDREHEWTHRPPPWNVPENELKFCPRESKRAKSCPHGECTYAHSAEELEEWKERATYRRMKIEKAKEQNMYSFLDQLLEKYNEDNSVLSESMENVSVVCSSEQTVQLVKTGSNKQTKHEWRFKISSNKSFHVGLLYDIHRQHFHVSDGKDKLQFASASKSTTEECDYEVTIVFESQAFGSFHQWVVFDFGFEPVLVRKLTVHVGSPEALESVCDARQRTDVASWNETNSNIIRFDTSAQSNADDALLKKYKDPSSSKEESLQVQKFELSMKNYIHQMHRLLNVEELSQMKILEEFCCKTRITVSKSITQESAFGTDTRYAQDGALYGQVQLEQELSDDYEAGRILLRSVSTVLVKECGSTSANVYEALVERDRDSSGFSKEVMFIQLGKQCCEDMGLQPERTIDVEIQFLINRLPFCRQHYALDALTSEKLRFLFPRFGPQEADRKQKLKKVAGLEMNRNQLRAVNSITGKGRAGMNPLLIYGPFGTGKTFTIAMTIKQLVTQQADARVLVCTLSNSAGDLYITQYFNEMVRAGCQQLKLLRIYTGSRRTDTIPLVIAENYLLGDVKGDTQEVHLPTPDDVTDIKKHSVVVTTLATSALLQQIGLEGHFTHIFIDEAGQALETEAIMPITLAGQNTKIILAGDHRQISPEVYSKYAQQNKFNHSLLTRLYKLYMDSGTQTDRYRILLDENYRSHEDILTFISRLFYGKELIASSNPPQNRHPEIYPLVFYSAYGEEQLVGTSYHNRAEVDELVERVQWLCHNWPKEWGQKELSHIGVVSPYASQVQQIRKNLRRVGLKEVTVENISNVQGKEFRAMFISTVRTQRGDMTDDAGGALNLGFLTDRKLLNTALTRAQSLVAVVGDPVALCSIGKCSNIWRRFIKTCDKNRSIHPDTVTLQSIEQQVMSRHVKLNPAAVEFIPRKKNAKKQDGTQAGSDNPSLETRIQSTQFGQAQKARYDFKSPAREKPPIKPPSTEAPTVEEVSFFNESLLEFDEWDSDDEDALESLDMDEILQELARQLDDTRKRYNEGRDLEDVVESGEESDGAESRRPGLNSSHRELLSDTGNQRRQRQRLGADHDEDYDSDSDDYMSDPYENENLETDESTLIKEYGKEALGDMMSSNPNVNKRCKLYIEPSRTYAVTLDETEGREIEITTKLKRGRALNNDEVVVEILNSENDFPDGDERREKTYGGVIGILERAVEPRLQKIACVLDEYSPNLMAPLNRSLPKMIWIHPGTKRRSAYSIPICSFTKGGNMNVKRYEKVTNEDRPNKVFLVRYLRWEPRYRYPICVVIDVFPCGDTLATGTAILKTVYGVKADYKTATKQETAQKYPDDWTIPPAEFKHRDNLQDLDVFTVDPAESTDLDDALSVEVVGDDQYRVGIHIADVSFFVHPESELDKEARRRATSQYPWKQTPIHMLPPQLSTKLCSLLPGEPRLALTLFLTLTEDAQISNREIRRSIIQSKAKLSYEQAEQVISAGEGIAGMPECLMQSIITLHMLTRKLKSYRLGDGRFCSQYESDDDVTSSPEAHSMVEELMLLANMQVANVLVAEFPQCTPLRRQKPPEDDKLTTWKAKHGSQIPNSLNMAVKSELLQLQDFLQPGQGADVDVLAAVWIEIVKAVQFGDMAQLQKLLFSDQNHPQLAVMLANYNQIQARAIYISSNSTREERSHFSLNVPEYTHFTSPIRRYIDVVVHRLVIAHLTSQKPHYSDADIVDICKHCNQQAAQAKEFERATMVLHVATALKGNPARTVAFVESASGDDIELHVQKYSRRIGSAERTVKLGTLKPSKQPVIEEGNDAVTLVWKERIYKNQAGTDAESDQPPTRHIHRATGVLSPDKCVKHIPGSLWQEMMACVINDDTPKLRTVLHRISIILNNPPGGMLQGFGDQTNSITEVIEEEIGPDTADHGRHFCHFQRTYTCGDVVEIQLSIGMKRGTLCPAIQLFNLTPKLDFCVEHRSNPIQCFAEVANERTAILRNKPNIEAYQRVWRKLIAMVSAYSAVRGGETVTIHDVGIQWSRCNDSAGTFEGIFRLPTAFCITRKLKFHGRRVEDKDLNRHYDFFCVRYQMLHESTVTHNPKGNTADDDRPHGFCWVGHCVATAVTENQEFTEVHIKLNQSKCLIPDKLLRQNPKMLLPCTVEWIPQTMPDSIVHGAIENLTRASKFVMDICSGQKIVMPDNALALTVHDTEIKTHPRPFYKLNPVQDQAVRTALSKPFTLIQGPPGTGKTVTGVHIAYWFVHLNRQLVGQGQRQIIYCGPSNKSIDVVAAYLKKVGPSLKIVRVYSRNIECQSFPVPGMLQYQRSGSEATMATDLKDVALHYLIRKPSNQHHRQLKEFDAMFRQESYKPEDVSDYLGLVEDAEKLEFQRSDIILCTCVTAGTQRIARGTQIQQCIVDECGMCTEPETIVPLVTTKPKQVVLIGDHKQLRPIVTEDIAKKLGMEISMLERYEKKTMMLTSQYRMHPGICEFPSDQFYEGRLETAKQVLQRPRGLDVWPGGAQNPTVFCHVVGTEERLTVSTPEGGEQSRSNLEEVEQVVRIARTLVNRYGVNPASIIILSQYRAQCSKITEKLMAKGHQDIAVSTVIVSQGSEWDYVIFSTVRSLPRIEIEERPSQGWLLSNLGFITDEHQINVAITRAKRGLVIVGNRELLTTHAMWRQLLRKYEEDGCLVNAGEFLRLPQNPTRN